MWLCELTCELASSNGKQTPRECQNHCSLSILFVMSLCDITWMKAEGPPPQSSLQSNANGLVEHNPEEDLKWSKVLVTI